MQQNFLATHNILTVNKKVFFIKNLINFDIVYFKIKFIKKMNSIVIQKTDSTPEISFLNKGELKITGRSLPEDVHKFYNPLIDWVKQISIEEVKVDLKLEYVNTASTKKILNLLIYLDENTKIKDLNVNWYYESDDLDMEDLGAIYEDELSRVKFHFIEGVDIF